MTKAIAGPPEEVAFELGLARCITRWESFDLPLDDLERKPVEIVGRII